MATFPGLVKVVLRDGSIWIPGLWPGQVAHGQAFDIASACVRGQDQATAFDFSCDPGQHRQGFLKHIDITSKVEGFLEAVNVPSICLQMDTALSENVHGQSFQVWLRWLA